MVNLALGPICCLGQTASLKKAFGYHEQRMAWAWGGRWGVAVQLAWVSLLSKCS